MPPGWIDDEPDFRAASARLARLLRRARRRPVAVVVLAVIVALGFGLIRARAPRSYRGRVILRASERGLSSGGVGRSDGQLRESVLTAAFSAKRLLDVMKSNGLVSPALASRDAAQAIQSVREAIEVGVFQNYFIAGRDRDDPLRSVRIAIGYNAPVPSLAIAMARELAGLVVEQEGELQRQQVEVAASQAEMEAADARGEVERLERDRAGKGTPVAGGSSVPDVERRVLWEQLRLSLAAARERRDSAQRRLTDAHLLTRAEAKDLGLRFEIVDPGRAPDPGRDPLTRVVLLALLASILALPGAAVIVGAADATVHDAADADEAGCPVIGHVPGLPAPGPGSAVYSQRS